ncbi:unnamed protein product [Mycena citricolor]|uniref:Uncharacterized protein n=1 Tax=Mycena citricolor TaxID=2018698 RepID=A0AAD2HMB2_9AGAR|nr:unnamed protein product [Mycena citricolor]
MNCTSSRPSPRACESENPPPSRFSERHDEGIHHRLRAALISARIRAMLRETKETTLLLPPAPTQTQTPTPPLSPPARTHTLCPILRTSDRISHFDAQMRNGLPPVGLPESHYFLLPTRPQHRPEHGAPTAPSSHAPSPTQGRHTSGKTEYALSPTATAYQYPGGVTRVMTGGVMLGVKTPKERSVRAVRPW